MTRNKQTPKHRPVVAALLAGLVGLFVFTAAVGSERTLDQIPASQAHANPAQEKAPAMQTVVIPIEGMSCFSCAARVTQALKSLPGVAHAEVNVAERNARVQFAPNEISVSRMVAAVNGLGYHASAPAAAK